jgi:hypothetical protein
MNRDARNALIRAHQNNINRYCRILATHLTDHEREYVHRRIAEERLALEQLLTTTTVAKVESGSMPTARSTARPSHRASMEAVATLS